jgi:hypothetical protein
MGDAFGLGAAMWILAGVSIAVAVVALFLRETAPTVLARRNAARVEVRKAA